MAVFLVIKAYSDVEIEKNLIYDKMSLKFLGTPIRREKKDALIIIINKKFPVY